MKYTNLKSFVRLVLLEIKEQDVYKRLSTKSVLKWAESQSENYKMLPADLVDYTWREMKNAGDEVLKIKGLRISPDDVAMSQDWMLSCIIKDKMRVEDIHKVLDPSDAEGGYLGKFLYYKSLLPRKDIRAYESPADLWSELKKFNPVQSTKVNPENIPNLVKFAEDERGAIYIPETVEASCEVGKGTEWCTAKYSPDDERNMYSSYTPQGPLYVYFDKRNKKRYQAHIDSNQMKDEDDLDVAHIPFLKLLNQMRVSNKRYLQNIIFPYTDPLGTGSSQEQIGPELIVFTITTGNKFEEVCNKLGLFDELIDSLEIKRIMRDSKLLELMVNVVLDPKDESSIQKIKRAFEFFIKSIYDTIVDAMESLEENEFGITPENRKILNELRDSKEEVKELAVQEILNMINAIY